MQQFCMRLFRDLYLESKAAAVRAVRAAAASNDEKISFLISLSIILMLRRMIACTNVAGLEQY
jgi:hypothetical protein